MAALEFGEMGDGHPICSVQMRRMPAFNTGANRALPEQYGDMVIQKMPDRSIVVRISTPAAFSGDVGAEASVEHIYGLVSASKTEQRAFATSQTNSYSVADWAGNWLKTSVSAGYEVHVSMSGWLGPSMEVRIPGLNRQSTSAEPTDAEFKGLGLLNDRVSERLDVAHEYINTWKEIQGPPQPPMPPGGGPGGLGGALGLPAGLSLAGLPFPLGAMGLTLGGLGHGHHHDDDDYDDEDEEEEEDLGPSHKASGKGRGRSAGDKDKGGKRAKK